jgi:hypothetical protein
MRDDIIIFCFFISVSSESEMNQSGLQPLPANNITVVYFFITVTIFVQICDLKLKISVSSESEMNQSGLQPLPANNITVIYFSSLSSKRL